MTRMYERYVCTPRFHRFATRRESLTAGLWLIAVDRMTLIWNS